MSCNNISLPHAKKIDVQHPFRPLKLLSYRGYHTDSTYVPNQHPVVPEVTQGSEDRSRKRGT